MPLRFVWTCFYRQFLILFRYKHATFAGLIFALFLVTFLTLRLKCHAGRAPLNWHVETTPFFRRKHGSDCRKIFADDKREVNAARKDKRPTMTAFESYELFANCSKVLQRHYYPTVSRSPTEAAFPLGYVVLLNEHLEQVEIAFNSIYAPQNFYCYQIDLKAPHVIYAAMERLSHCFPNVVVSRRPFSLTRASEHNLEAQMQCIDELYLLEEKTKMTKWRYLIILETHDFPLRNNEEIVRILDLYNDQNDVELTHDIPSRTKYIFEPSFDELGMHNGLEYQLKITRGPPPARITLYKGYSEVSLSRAFVNSIRKHPVTQQLLKYLENSDSPTEAFWSTLTHDENLQLPGSYPGRCLQTNNRKTFLTRFTIWQWDKYPCRGYWRNSICVFSSADLPFLVNRPELFANKFWLPEDPISVDCLHELLYNRTYLTDGITSFNIDAYANTSAVLYRKWLHEQGNKVNAVFACPGIID